MNTLTRAEREAITEAGDDARAFVFNLLESDSSDGAALTEADEAGRIAAQVEAVVVAGLTALFIDEEPADVIRRLRDEFAALEERRAQIGAELAAALIAAGRRPGDGSDQAALFTRSRTYSRRPNYRPPCKAKGFPFPPRETSAG